MGSSTALVYVNDVEVGSLPTEQYYQLVKEVRRQKMLYFLQALNMANVAARLVFVWLQLAAILGAIIVCGLALSGTATLTEVFSSVQAAPPKALAQTVHHIAVFCLSMASVGVVLLSAVGRLDSGYVNQFNRTISLRLRQLMEVPAEGTVQVVLVAEKEEADRSLTIEVGCAHHNGQ